MATTRVLLAGRDKAELRELRAMLERHGFVVVDEAGDEATRARLARLFRPDVIVTDLAILPRHDRTEVLKALIEERIAAVVVLTSYENQLYVDYACRAGVLGYLIKPFGEAQLIAAIQVALARHRELRELEAKPKHAEALARRRARRAARSQAASDSEPPA